MAEAVALSVVEKIGGCLIEPIQREFGYLFCFNNNFQDLQNRLGDLKATRDDVYAREGEAQSSSKTLGEAAKKWMVDAKREIKEAENVIVHKAELQKGCFSIKWCPNLKLRFSLGRKAKKLSLLLNDLLERGDKLPQTGVALPPPPINISDYIKADVSDFDSRRKVMEEIIEMLQDKETRLIGICGMGGIGKTTFAMQVLQKVQYLQLFDIQVISTVSRNPNYNTIQQEVVEILKGSSLQGIVSEYARADLLRNSFNNKKVVVLLDDVWEEFDLIAKGFPLLSKSDVECCCKIIYTSRKNDLWSGERTITKQIISLDLLSDEEAFNLFRKNVCLDDHDDEFREKKEIEKEIVEECGRLPLALEVVGVSLFHKRIYEWNNMLSCFRDHHQDQTINKINKVLETSYNFLNDPNLKLLFLLCCLFREDQEIPIETLYRYAVGLQLFQDIKDLKDVRNYVYTLVDDLIRRSLLINVEVFHYSIQGREGAVKMHDVVRDVGISIAKKRENAFNFLVSKSANGLDTDFGHHTKMISIILFQNIDPVSPQLCDVMKFRGTNVELQLLQLDIVKSFGINMLEDFFQEMHHVKVLVIYGNNILNGVPSKLSSFSYLTNLKMLSLEYLNINNLSTIRHLSFLEILSFRFSSMRVLPNEISELTNLRNLDLTGCRCLISNGVLSKLTNLQELYMWDSFKDWRVPIEENLPITTNEDNNVAAELIELNHLNKLWRLEFEVINIEQLPRNVTLLPSSKLLKFKIRIRGEEINKNIFEGGERLIWLNNVDEKVFHTIGIMMENKVTDIVLINCESVITLSSLINSSRQTSINELVDHLKRIEIRKCNQMMYLNDCSEVRGLQKIEFNYLESLILKDLCKLKCFYKGINKICFPKLKTLELVRLEQFILPTNVQLEMPLLEKLNIASIPHLENLCNFVAPSMKELEISDCPDFKYVLSSASSSMMENICHLSSLVVERCSSLKGILSVSIGAQDNWNKLFEFSNLWKLELKFLCKLVSFVIDEEETLQTSLFYHDEVSFPVLKVLWISELPKINYIVGWNGLQQQGRGYDRVTDNKRKLQPHILFPILYFLQIDGLDNLKHIYESNHPKLEPGVLLFQNLNHWMISCCPQLKYLFSENIGRVTAKHLQTLYIFSCPMIEVVMKKDDDEYDDKTGGGGESINFVPYNYFFPLLKELKLSYLPKLKRFCDIAYTWDLPSLNFLNVLSCSKLEALSPGCLNSPKLKTLRYNGREKNAGEDINNTLRRLFNRVDDNEDSVIYEVDDREDEYGVDNEVVDKKDDDVDDC